MVTFARWTALILVAGLVAATLVPLEMRPVLIASPTLERALAYFVVGLVLSVANPQRTWLVLAGVVTVAGLLEYGQTLTASRHGGLRDFLVKAAAASLGVVLGALVLAFARPRPDA